jgi:hypothetical protein
MPAWVGPGLRPLCPGLLVSVSGQPLHPLQKEFFQDDVFPDTAVTWEPALSAKAWFEGANGQPRLLSLQPPGMTPGRVRNKTGRQQGRGIWTGVEGGTGGPSTVLRSCCHRPPKDVRHVSRPSL